MDEIDTCTNRMGENSSSILTCYVKVPWKGIQTEDEKLKCQDSLMTEDPTFSKKCTDLK